jgi:hypothetical protein
MEILSLNNPPATLFNRRGFLTSVGATVDEIRSASRQRPATYYAQ